MVSLRSTRLRQAEHDESGRLPCLFVRSVPDLQDFFAPDLESVHLVECFYCGRRYPENQIKWEPAGEGLWVCKYWPSCHGGGLGFDIYRIGG